MGSGSSKARGLEVGMHTTVTRCHMRTQCYAYLYANSYEYYEAHYLAGPGDYQTMILANNYMGRPSSYSGFGPSAFVRAYGPIKHIRRSDLRRFRETNIINGYGFCAPERDFGGLWQLLSSDAFWIGPTAWDIGSVTQGSRSLEK